MHKPTSQAPPPPSPPAPGSLSKTPTGITGLDEVPLVDRSTLAELCEDDPGMHRDLIDLFVAQAQGSVADIARAVQSGDADALQRDAHQLKGSSASVGALRMAELSDRLCQAGRSEQLDGTAALVEALERASELTGAAWGEGS
jgi:HPt (histidine-containing phosphotransfer) domain-containing protein